MDEKLNEINKRLNKIAMEINSISMDLLCSEEPFPLCQATPVVEDEIIDTKEAARLLKVSKPTLMSCIKSGKVKATKIGRNWRFSRNYIISIANS